MAETVGESREQAQELVRATVLLSRKEVEDLKKLAEAEGVSANDVLASAIATFKFFKDAEREGATVLLQRPDGKFERVRLR